METSELISWRLLGDWGIKLVIIGVIIEVVAAVIDFATEHNCPTFWKQWKARLRLIEFAGGGILILGLVMERKGHNEETHILDGMNAKLHERAANTESNNLTLRSNVVALETAVRELAHLYDQSTNALAEAKARLSSIRPVKDRLIDFFNGIDPKIIPALRSGNMVFRLSVPADQYSRLSVLIGERESKAYVSSTEVVLPNVFTERGQVINLIVVLKPELAK